MKLKKLTSALIMAGACSVATAGVYDEGSNPGLQINEESLIVQYEAMMSIAGAMVVAETCQILEDKGPYAFVAKSNAAGKGSIEFGEDSDLIILDVEPVPEDPNLPAEDYGRMFKIAQDGDGVFYFGGKVVWGYNVPAITGKPEAFPAFSPGGAIYQSSAYFRIYHSGSPPTSPNWSLFDEHVIKDFYRLESVDGKCDTNNPNCTPELAFFDWGLEVITKLDYPFYKYRQDSEHVPWNGQSGAWIVRKSLLTGTTDETTFCNMKASGTFTAPGGDAIYRGMLYVSTQQL